MQSSGSLSSIASSASSNLSIYGSQTILDAKDLHLAAPRCRSSIVAFLEDDQTLFSLLPPLPRPPRRRSHLPSSSTNKPLDKCRHLFRTCLSSTSSPLALPSQAKLSNSTVRKQYFAKLCHNYRLLLVLSDYECQCGCHFSIQQGSYVIMYETKKEMPMLKRGDLVTVISNELVCSKVPTEYVCDVELLRERVRLRHHSGDDEQSFDL